MERLVAYAPYLDLAATDDGDVDLYEITAWPH